MTARWSSPLAAVRGWPPVVVLPAVGLFAPPAWPRWAVMWLVAGAFYASFKWLTWRRARDTGAPWWLHAGYLLAWPGMDAARFLRRPSPAPRRPTTSEWGRALAGVGVGAVVLWVMVRWLPTGRPLLAGWTGMVGVVLLLHFGVFGLLSCAWRHAGVDATPPMQTPLSSCGIAEFWGRRWNTAFRDLAHRFLFRPLAARLGPRTAVLSGFLFSGLVHDLVISVPAGAGLGGPTAFFLVQGLALLFERSGVGRRLGLGRGRTGRAFTAAVLLLPVGLLFHRPFVERVVLPFLRVLGAG